MSYETYRNEVFYDALNDMDRSIVEKLMEHMDRVAEKYEFERKCTDIIPFGGIPEDLIKAYIASKAVANIAIGTIKNYYSIIMNMFRFMQTSIDRITGNSIRIYLNDLQRKKHNAASTANNKRVVLRDFFQWCVEEDVITKNPFCHVDPIRFNDNIREPLTNMELAQVRSSCKDLREKLLVEFLFSTGCRIAEVADMKISDIDIESHTVIIRHGKGNKRRKSYLNADTIVAIRKYLDGRNDDCEYLFVCKRTTLKHGVGKRALEQEINRIVQRAGIKKKITPHNFRHTTATYCSASGMPIEEVQKLLGHASIKTTQRYISVNDDNVKNHHWQYM